jgi:hypothetical protein
MMRPSSAAAAAAAGSDEGKTLSVRELRAYQEYSAAHVQDALQGMMVALFTETPLPADPLGFMQDFLAAKAREQASREGDGGKAREQLRRRLNHAAGQLDAAGLQQLVESAERQAADVAAAAASAAAAATAAAAAAAAPADVAAKPSSSPPRAAQEVLVTFTEPGSLGMKLNDHEGTGQPRVVAINAGTQAENHPQLKKDLLITRIGTTNIVGMAYKSVLGVLKAAGRPCTIAFVPLEAKMPNPDLDGLQAAAEAASEKAARSRSLRQSRQRRKGMSVAQGDGTMTQLEMEAALAEMN